MSIEAVAFDIGGVLALVNKKPLKDRGELFFDNDFLLFQRGLLRAEHFLERKATLLNIEIAELKKLFISMIDVSAHASIIHDLKVPYFFISNINELHYRHVTALLKPSSFALRHSLLSYRLGLLKPHAHFYRALSFKAKNIAYIDDNNESVMAAKEAGFITRWCSDASMLSSLVRELNLLRC